MNDNPDLAKAVSRAIFDPGKITPRRQDTFGVPSLEPLDLWQARAVLEAVGPFLRDDSQPSAADLVKWLHEQAAEYRDLSQQDGSTVLYEGARATQKALADSLTAAVAHIAVMRPEIPHA